MKTSFKLRPGARSGAARIMALSLLLLTIFPGVLKAQQPATADPKRAQALELYKQNRCLDALPLFEELAAANPADALMQEGLGVCLQTHAATLTVPEERQREMKRSRETLARAKELGDSSEIVRVLLELTPADGNLGVFSGRGDVDTAMREGEAAFARRDLDAAIAAYQHAFLLDPKLYDAPLFIGDSYFTKKDYGNAEAWFAVAVSVNEDRETAYRYWGDALLREGKKDEAHAKYIEAVIAEPYAQRTWVGLDHWAQAAGRRLSQPQIASPNQSAINQGKTNVTVDAAVLTRGDGSSAWLVYEITRAAWQKKFATQFPQEKEYRHSLAEEAEALGNVVAVVGKLPEQEKANLNPALKTLVELSDHGLLESYILFARADEGMAKDYPAYRASHRPALRQYLRDYVGLEKR